ncbi:MAG TPA: RodZ domain-containing protein [Rhizomicrobium sp.]|nr:RodZ domain-containing protein [Rhizomicrobium sp.]
MTKITQIPVKNDGGRNMDGLNTRRIHLREISGDSESPLETVGHDLRAARLRRGDEIAQVSRALKIRKDHLEALENDRLEDLPGKTYAIGFVRSYARHLGLDAAQYVERFKRDISGRADEQAREPVPLDHDDRRLPHGWRLIAGAVTIALIWGTWHLLAPNTESNQAVPPAPVLTAPKPVAKPAPAPVVAPPQSAVPSPATSTVPVIDGGGPQQASATPPPAAGSTAPATRATPLSVTSPTAAPQSPPQAQTQSGAAVPAVSAGQTYGAMNRNPRVILRMRADAHLVVRGPDGRILLNRGLKNGDSYRVPNTPGVTMATDNAGAVEVDLDGTALGRAGAPLAGLPELSLDPQSLADNIRR